MSLHTTIEWTNATWNPVRGCEKISPGCAHCYAETFAERFRGVEGHPYQHGFDLRLAPNLLAEPLRWPASRRVFTCSMSDLFHKGVPLDYLRDVFRVVELADWHVFQVLTKRADRLRELLTGPLAHAAALPNVWWGVSVENRAHGLPRIDHLRQVPARVRWLSVEPLLEDPGEVNLEGIAWLIVGGETGHGARPMAVEWARGLRERARAAGAAFFYKQGSHRLKSKAGRELDGALVEEMPESHFGAVPDRAERKRRLAEAEALAAKWA
jgi:protein gp37